jgi:hypothetical protein
MERWPAIWKELRHNLSHQPRCPDHPEHPCVHTLVQGVPNDILEIRDDGILVRSHRTMNADFIPAHRVQRWWEHLATHGSASLHTGSENNPHRWRSRIVGAVVALGLPRHVRPVDGSTLELIEQRPG